MPNRIAISQKTIIENLGKKKNSKEHNMGHFTKTKLALLWVLKGILYSEEEAIILVGLDTFWKAPIQGLIFMVPDAEYKF